MPAAGSHNMHGHATVEQQRFVSAPQVVQPQFLEPDLAGFAGKLLRDRAGNRHSSGCASCCHGVEQKARTSDVERSS